MVGRLKVLGRYVGDAKRGHLLAFAQTCFRRRRGLCGGTVMRSEIGASPLPIDLPQQLAAAAYCSRLNPIRHLAELVVVGLLGVARLGDERTMGFQLTGTDTPSVSGPSLATLFM